MLELSDVDIAPPAELPQISKRLFWVSSAPIYITSF